MKLLKIYCTIAIVGFSFNLSSQNEEKKLLEKYPLFHSIGFSTFLDLMRSPIEPAIVQNGFLPDQETPRMVNSFAQSEAFSFGTLIYEVRANLKEISDNAAFGIGLTPAIGFSFVDPVAGLNGVSGLGHVQLAGMAKIIFGQMATRRSASDYGVTIGAGYELNKIGMISQSPKSEGEQIPNSLWLMPTVSIGINAYRYGAPVEFNIKIGRGSADYYDLDRLGTQIPRQAGSAYSLRLAVFYQI
jgi:hypothetical protein